MALLSTIQFVAGTVKEGSGDCPPAARAGAGRLCRGWWYGSQGEDKKHWHLARSVRCYDKAGAAPAWREGPCVSEYTLSV
jgi:hypothetical protein